MLRLESVSVALDGVPILDGVTVSIATGSWTCLVGPNGAGKTTLIRALSSLAAYSGDIYVDDVPLSAMQRRRLAQTIAYVPQRPVIPLAMEVIDYVLLGRTPYIPYLGSERRSDVEVVRQSLERLDLVPFAQRTLDSLSGGELQRVILARALAQQARILLLDEPTSALDVGHQQQVLELIDLLRRQDELTIVSAMHDLTVAGQFANHLVMLDGGRVVASGTATDVLTEETIATHYRASVSVVADDEGIVVVPRRQTARQSVTR